MQITTSLYLKDKAILENIYGLFTRKKFEVLVFSFLVLIFGNTFHQSSFMAIVLPLQNMLAALTVFYSQKSIRYTIASFVVIVINVAIINCFYLTQQGVSIILIVYFLYYILIAWKVYTKIFTAKYVSAEVLAVLVCGFILLCLTDSIMFIAIEVNYPHSYSHLGVGHHRNDDLIYFCFSTILTTGYGDIAPLSLLAKRSVMLAGLTGHLYTVFVTGIIIGKYLRDQRN